MIEKKIIYEKKKIVNNCNQTIEKLMNISMEIIDIDFISMIYANYLNIENIIRRYK